ncbi:FAD-binding domain-containing protein [Xylariaceae sp. FL1651]|nr:FAD-binding domain-containing protein [Xylariaceae sp. FL1651]
MSLQIAAELKRRLSPSADIFGPRDEEFPGLVSRWREYHAPTVAALVQVVTESDIQEAIDLRKMSYMNVAEGGNTAKIGGGATVKRVVDALGEAGKRTVTGICESVGISALVLGGGHGWLQGEYGLAADQIYSNPDLFWAIRNAGHNFGLVAEWTYPIYDVNPQVPKWSFEIFIFSGDKLEALYSLHNEMQKNQPAHAIHWSYIIRVAQINPDHVTEAREYARPLCNIEAMSIQAGVATTHELATLTYQDKDGPGCVYGLTSLRYPIGLKTFNVPAIRKEIPEIAGSFFLLKGYSTQAVQAVDEKSTAFPHRSDEILVTSYVQYKPDPRIDPLAMKYGKTLRQILLDASGDPGHLRAYVNYAHGDEDLREVYGWEDWRLQKLRELKAQWDPENKMKYYMPIVGEANAKLYMM